MTFSRTSCFLKRLYKHSPSDIQTFNDASFCAKKDQSVYILKKRGLVYIFVLFQSISAKSWKFLRSNNIAITLEKKYMNILCVLVWNG